MHTQVQMHAAVSCVCTPGSHIIPCDKVTLVSCGPAAAETRITVKTDKPCTAQAKMLLQA